MTHLTTSQTSREAAPEISQTRSVWSGRPPRAVLKGRWPDPAVAIINPVPPFRRYGYILRTVPDTAFLANLRRPCGTKTVQTLGSPGFSIAGIMDEGRKIQEEQELTV